MRSLNPMSLLECLLLCVPIGAIAVWAWGWRTLAMMLLGAIVVGLLFDAALQDDPTKDRILAFLALTLIGAAGSIVAGVAALTIATPLGVLQW